MSTSTAVHERVGLTPDLVVEDPVAAWWLRQTTLRLRREVAWVWRRRSGSDIGPDIGPHRGPDDGPARMWAGPLAAASGEVLPPPMDRGMAALDLMRFDREKRAFFRTDPAAAWLSARMIDESPPSAGARRGGFGDVADRLELRPVDRFVLALALLDVVDSAAGPVFATCLEIPGRARPTLALAQRLWDRPSDLCDRLDAAHPLVRTGLLAPAGGWESALEVPGSVARQLLFPDSDPAVLKPVTTPPLDLPAGAVDLWRASVESTSDGPTVLPLIAPAAAPVHEAAARLADAVDARAVTPASDGLDLRELRTLAWLRGDVLLLSGVLSGELPGAPSGAPLASEPRPFPLPTLPGAVVVSFETAAGAARMRLPSPLPVLEIPPLDTPGRIEAWRRGLGPLIRNDAVRRQVLECARTFRLERSEIVRRCRMLESLDRPLKAGDVESVCTTLADVGVLGRRTTPRFALEELILPERQAGQVRDLVRSASALATVHHAWGTARPWSEAGLTALFAGPPGTGKTMAAEAVATELGRPLVRIDLSQVVDKYIGETEKNIGRVFDAADAGGDILFFDEADALFGKRTEVRDAHDRYANLEVSYLLDRMERFRGLAILATNRRKDLDDAFMRRLRYVIDFPLPGEDERRRIWRRSVPDGVDARALDFDFLASSFSLSGGHIRSAVFQACLLRAAAGATTPMLEMPEVVRAVRDELEKTGRAVSLGQFGPWADCIRPESR